ncbi:DMT family transporter [Thiorhodovibrio frisius]|uniref:DMT family transporter n=1 Tax=Thiorhodovibrio frisius TaxID=631362 RepID=UPI001CC05636|nr:DMT family transporter [Thiorhodovibrio frisius]
MLFGATLWGLYWLPLRLIEQAGLPVLWGIGIIYLASSGALGWLARADLIAPRPASDWLRLTGIGLSGATSGIAFNIGVIEGEVARVLLLFYLSPLWSVILARWLLAEPLARYTPAALTLALAGAALMLITDLDAGSAAISRADLLGLIAGFGFALTNVQLRATQSIPARLKNLAAVALVSPLALAAGMSMALPMSFPPIAVLASLVLGLFWMSSMIATVQIGVSALPVQQSSVLLLTELIVGALSAALIAGEQLALSDLVGGLAIVIAGLITVLSNRRCSARLSISE